METVSEYGWVKGIKATYNGKSYFCTVTVKNVMLSKTNVQLNIDEACHLALKNAYGETISDDYIT